MAFTCKNLPLENRRNLQMSLVAFVLFAVRARVLFKIKAHRGYAQPCTKQNLLVLSILPSFYCKFCCGNSIIHSSGWWTERCNRDGKRRAPCRGDNVGLPNFRSQIMAYGQCLQRQRLPQFSERRRWSSTTSRFHFKGPTEQRCSTCDQELFAVYPTVKLFGHYAKGWHLIFFTNRIPRDGLSLLEDNRTEK